ncbi:MULTISPECIES: hypothetical protein [Paenibacillus]|uniref:Uncharacterized protein n=1 Tax=Paenibacillus albilobatus TaxID=2716884 RepID=A0A919XF21_9BACL|nr:MULTISPECIES: hypothetical protein [Paenibacillus]MDR9854322.1 hypothetical protein [Paenibacillus sp. VCA1]GIO30218.1 hypothetical protein J2TS6_13590 [Paenibacillus albilobatus]
MSVPGITRDELSLIKSYLLLQFIHKVFERDLRIMEESGVFKTPELYMEVVAGGDRQAMMLLSGVKREFKSRRIRVYEISQDERGIGAQYVCRGYTGEMNILWPAFRSEMMARMKAYLGLRPETDANGFSPDPLPSSPVSAL